ncbi:hypothetical protein N665_7158s0003, partial [Sinapis alba]
KLEKVAFELQVLVSASLLDHPSDTYFKMDKSSLVMNHWFNVNEFQELAKRALPKMYYDFYSGGAEDQHTLKENVEAFTRIMFRPRVLVDVSKIDMSTRILGY